MGVIHVTSMLSLHVISCSYFHTAGHLKYMIGTFLDLATCTAEPRFACASACKFSFLRICLIFTLLKCSFNSVAFFRWVVIFISLAWYVPFIWLTTGWESL